MQNEILFLDAKPKNTIRKTKARNDKKIIARVKSRLDNENSLIEAGFNDHADFTAHHEFAQGK